MFPAVCHAFQKPCIEDPERFRLWSIVLVYFHLPLFATFLWMSVREIPTAWGGGPGREKSRMGSAHPGHEKAINSSPALAAYH